MKIPKIGYDLYYKFSDNKLTKLNLSLCENTTISLSIPVSITENIDKLNTSSDYFNDVCYVSSSESGTDISLMDRKKEFVDGNKTICQEDCIFSEYNFTIQKAKCDCKFKESSSSIVDININKEKLFENFKDIKNIINFQILVCHDNLFNPLGISENIGFYVLTLIIVFHIISTFIFYMKHSNIITKHINNIIFGIKNYKLLKPEQKTKINKTNNINKRNSVIETNNIYFSKNNKNIVFQGKKKNSLKIKNANKAKEKVKNIKNIKNLQENKKFRRNKKSKSINNIQNNIIFNNNSNIFNNKKNNMGNNIQETNRKKNIIKSKLEQIKIKKVKLIMKYTDEEINKLPYDLALLYDKRSFCEYYTSLLKTNHILIFSFCFKNDYNSKIIKMYLFFVSFAIYYTTNALFFDDDTMHTIYINKGSFDLEYQLPKILYSSLISFALNKILTLLALSDDELIDLKKIRI